MPGKVTVACKLPNGLKLRFFTMVDHDEPVMGGGMKTVKRAMHTGETIAIHGPATPFGQMPKALIVGGYALTPNVDADFFAEWLKHNKDLPAVKERLIFAHEKREMAEGKATEQTEILSGLHPLIPDTDARIPRGNANLSKPVTADRAA